MLLILRCIAWLSIGCLLKFALTIVYYIVIGYYRNDINTQTCDDFRRYEICYHVLLIPTDGRADSLSDRWYERL